MFRKMPSANISPDLVVAMGAGIQAGLKQQDKELDDVVLTDVCPYSLGVGIMNPADSKQEHGNIFSPIIERNSPIPISIEHSFCTAQKNQRQVLLEIYQGESRLVKNNIYLGQIECNVPKGAIGEQTVDVRFSYDMNGILDVDVVVTSTGKTYNATIVNSADSLSEKEIEASKKKLSKLKFHPRDQEENRLVLARAERLYQTLLEEQRQYIGDLVTSFEQILQKQNPKKIEKAREEVNQILDQFETSRLFS
jgi:molecular chaperone HscC